MEKEMTERAHKALIAQLADGSAVNLLRSLDLSVGEDTQKFRELIRGAMWGNMGYDPKLDIVDAGGNLIFSNYTTRNLRDTLNLGLNLRKMAESPADLLKRMLSNGHGLVKIPSEEMPYWGDGRYKSFKERLNLAREDNSELFLALMGASAQLASQSLNRYRTGLFLGTQYSKHICPTDKGPKYCPQEGTVDERGVPLEYPHLGKLVIKHEELFNIWNRVILKYFSHMIHNSEAVLSGKSERHNVKKLCEYVPTDTWEVHELITEDLDESYTGLIQNMRDNPSKHSSGIEERARIATEKIRDFCEVLQEYDSRMCFVKPSV
jgi:hypothetical protein